MSGALLVAGTTSDAGKSMVVAGLCRLLARRGVRVAPFKAQNMSHNSAVTRRRAARSAGRRRCRRRAAGSSPSVAFNPVLLKPGSDRTSQVVRARAAVGDRGAPATTATLPDRLRDVVAGRAGRAAGRVRRRDLRGRRARPAEINLRATDIANMGLARAARPAGRSSSATSTAAACSRTCSARSRCSSPTTRR